MLLPMTMLDVNGKEVREMGVGIVTAVGVDPREPTLICHRFSVYGTVGHGSAPRGATPRGQGPPTPGLGTYQEGAPGAKEWEAGTGHLALLRGHRVGRAPSPPAPQAPCPLVAPHWRAGVDPAPSLTHTRHASRVAPGCAARLGEGLARATECARGCYGHGPLLRGRGSWF